MNSKPQVENVSINALRTIAALFVVFEHVRAMFFRDYSDVHHSPLAALFYFGTALGNEAVMVFFVLSGFWVGLSVIERFRAQTFSWLDYAIQRLTRLWVVLVPAIVLTAACVYAGLTFFARSGPYTGNPAYHNLAPVNLAERSGFLDAVGNVFFVQTILVPSFGTNSPLWSLAYEFWYYALFPLALMALVKRSHWHARVGAAAAFVLIAYFVGGSIMAYFGVWLLGALLAYFKRPVENFISNRTRISRMLLGWSAVGVLGVGLLIHQTEFLPKPMAVTVLSIATTLVIATLVLDFKKGGIPYRLARPAHIYAEVSYTLYLTHAPILLLFTAAVLPNPATRWGPGLASYLGFAMIVATLMLVAWGVGLVTELRTKSIRRYAGRVLRRSAGRHAGQL